MMLFLHYADSMLKGKDREKTTFYLKQ